MKRHYLFFFIVLTAVALAEPHAESTDPKVTAPKADEAGVERPKQDPTTLKPEEVSLLSSMFRIPKDTVADLYGGKHPELSIPKGVDAAKAGDEAPMARLLADLYGTLDRPQADLALGLVEKARNAELANTPPDARAMALLDRLFWAGKILDGNPAQVEGSEKYNEAFGTAFKGRQDRIADMKEKVKDALAGNNKAKEALRGRLNRKMLMAFVEAQRKAGNVKLANDIIDAVSFGGQNGKQKFLDLKVGKENQRLNLGLTRESMEQALNAFSDARGGLHTTTLSGKAFSIPDRTFSVDTGGKLASSASKPRVARQRPAAQTKSTRVANTQTETQAKAPEKSAKPSADPATPPAKGTNPPAKSGEGDAKALKDVISANCTGCHNLGDPEVVGDGKIKKGSKEYSVADAIAATKRVPAMRGAVSDAVRSSLQAFVK